MTKKALLGSVVAAIMVAGLSRTASAAAPRQGDTYATIDAHLGYGISTNDDVAANANPFGFQLGLRGGGTFGPGVYVGANFDYFFGEDRGQSVTILGVTAGGSASVNTYHFLAEVGYDAWIYRSGVLRPKLGLGIGWLHFGGCGGATNIINLCGDRTDDGFTLAPGLQFLHFFGMGFLTAELRYETILVDGPNPSAILMTIGGGVGF